MRTKDAATTTAAQKLKDIRNAVPGMELQRDIAEAVDSTDRTISRLERGGVPRSALKERIHRWSKGLGLPELVIEDSDWAPTEAAQ